MYEQLNLEDKQKFQMFINQATRLSSCKFFKNGNPKRALGFDDGETKAIVPERQEFIEAITILRPFIMDNDDVFFNKIVHRIRKYVDGSESSSERLNVISNEFKFYREAQYSDKYQRNYSRYISNYSDTTCDFGEQTIFKILDLVINGYYFHSDVEKQKELVEFVKEQKKQWLGSLEIGDLAEESLIVIRGRVRESFKYRLYGLIVDIADCVFNLKKLIEELFGSILDEELHQESKMLYDFLDI
jgi:hypothetical protein